MIILVVIIALLAGLAAYFLGQQSAVRGLDATRAEKAQIEQGLAAARATISSLEQQRDSVQQQAQASLRAANQLQADKSRLEAQLEAARAQIEQERMVLAKARSELTDTFKALAGEALHSSASQFLQLATERFNNLQSGAQAELEQRKQAIEGLVRPVADSLGKVDAQIQAIEKDRVGSYQSLLTAVAQMQTTQEGLRKETTNLVGALRRPNVRGRWGELQLRRVVELAGMLDRVDFQEQVSVEADDGALRPDLVVRLPGDKRLIVDAKVPLAAYLESIETSDDEIRRQKLVDHARQIRDHIQKLSAKSYWAEFETPEFVVLFIPGEVFYSAALEADPSLIENGIDRKVILATPTTLIALLKTVAYGWRQEALANDARKIALLGRDLYDRIATLAEHWEKMGNALSGATKAYNNAVASMESRVLPSARRFKELNVVTEGKSIEMLETLDALPRSLTAEEFATTPAADTE